MFKAGRLRGHLGTLLFQDLGGRKVLADFSGGTLSSDGGVLLLRQVDANLGLTRSLAQCFYDHRNQVFVDHSVLLCLLWISCAHQTIRRVAQR
jgi:DDE family transposase